MDDPIYMNPFLWTILIPVFGWWWKVRKDDLESLRGEITMKADKEDVAAQSNSIAELAHQHTQLREDMHKGFADLTQLVHQSQITILRELAHKADK